MEKTRLIEIASLFPAKRIAIIGDFFLDKYLDFDPSLAEVSLETGKIAYQVVNIRHSPGAAGNVANNIAGLGVGCLCAVGFTGDDGEGYELRHDLSEIGCSTDHLIYAPDRHTPTYLKPQNACVPGLAGEESRFDTKNRISLQQEISDLIIEQLKSIVNDVDAVIVIDQADEDNCGVITDSVRDSIIDLAGKHPDIVFWTDSRQRACKFRNTFLKPNQFEAVKAAFPDYRGLIDDDIVSQSGNILAKRNGRPVFLTRGGQGIMVFADGKHESVPGFDVEGEIDPTGAGDSVTAAAVLSLVCGASYPESALIANLAASITVKKLGVTGTASVEELIAGISK